MSATKFHTHTKKKKEKHPWPTLLYNISPLLSHVRKKVIVIEHKMRVSIRSTTAVCNIFRSKKK
jgi:hypothetical protein